MVPAKDALITGEQFFEQMLSGPVRSAANQVVSVASRTKTLLNATDPAFRELLERVPSSGTSLSSILPRTAAAVSRFATALGPLPVLAPTLLGVTPMSDQARTDAEAFARLQSVEPWQRTTTTSRSAPTSNLRRRSVPAPAPPAPPGVPSLPGLSPEQLRQALGESSSSAKPAPSSRAARQRGGAGPLPGWAETLANVAGPLVEDLAKTLAYRYLPENVVDQLRRDLRRPRRRTARAPKSGFLPPSFGFAPETSADTSPRTRPLTDVTSGVLQPPRNRDECRCERPTPRPSDKVPTVRSYKRRMSQNSLDNLRRG